MAAAYSASKAAVIALTKAVGKDFAAHGVSVNCIAPAVIETPILDGLSPEHVDYMVERIPMGRMGDAGRGRRADLLARERGVLVLDRGHVRHLRRPGARLLMRHVRAPTDRDGVGRGDATALAARRRSRTSRHAASTLARARSTRPRSGAPGSPTSAAATRASRSRAATSTRSSTTPTGPSSSSRTPPAAAPSGPGEPIGDPLGRDVERAGAGDRRRARRRARDRRVHDRQRRLLARHRGREPALPAAGEGVRGRVRDRPRRLRAGGLGRAARDRADDPRRRRRRCSSPARRRRRG